MLIERPFKILGIQQVAIGALDKDRLLEFWVGLLGIRKIGNYQSAAENVNEDICQIGESFGTYLFLIFVDGRL